MAITKVSPDLLDLDSGITITTADNSDNLTLTSTDADANVAPNLRMYRNSSSPADSDQLGKIQYEGRNDNSQDVIYGEIGSQIKDASDGTEDGRVFINTMLNGGLASRVNIMPTELVINDESNDLDFRVESNDEANMLFVNAGGNAVGIGTATPSGRLQVQMSHTETNVTLANNNETLVLGNSGSGNGVYNAIKFSGNQQDMYIMSFNDQQIAARRIGFFLGSVAGDAVADERLSIRGDGKVGIGTSSPSATLHVDASGGANFQVSRTGVSDMFYVEADGTNAVVRNPGSNNLVFQMGGTSEKMRIDSSGRLLVGTTSVYSDNNDKFVVNGGRSNFTASGISSGAFNRQTSTGDIVAFLYNGSGKGSISTDGSNIAYNTSSDARLKNILGEAKGLDIVSQLNPVNFEWKESGKTQDGLIAQEVKSLIPEAVSTNEHTGFYEMDYSKLVTPLVKAIQEQQTIIKDLKARIETLEG